MEQLEQRISEALAAKVDPAIERFAAMLARESGALAILFYGSNLRSKSLDGVIDFYVLLPGEQVERIWPRVSYREWEFEGRRLRAKIATMALETFARAASGETLDTTIWARFVQPSALVWHRDNAARAAVIKALASAARTAARLAVVLGPSRGSDEDYWRALFRATYAAEFRVESPGREQSILEANAAHFDRLLPLALAADGIGCECEAGVITPQMDRADRQTIQSWWARRARIGKALNLVRLAKASLTFDGAARYAAWKVERHTGVRVKLTPWREKHPLLAAPGVLIAIWREKRAKARR